MPLSATRLAAALSARSASTVVGLLATASSSAFPRWGNRRREVALWRATALSRMYLTSREIGFCEGAEDDVHLSGP